MKTVTTKTKNKQEPKINPKTGEPNTVNDELRLALWFVDQIGDPLRARQLVTAAVSALGIVDRHTTATKLEITSRR